MEIKVKYFGQITDITNMDEEIFTIGNDSTVRELSEKIISKYSSIEHISFRIALNHEFVEVDTKIKENDEIALLPPFAGG